MDDLLTEKGRQEARSFFDFVCMCMENGHCEPAPEAFPSPRHMPVTVPAAGEEEKSGDVVILTTCDENDTRLQSMIERFRAVLPRKTRVVNLLRYPFLGGCLGCFNCAVSGKCIYTDGFDDYLRNHCLCLHHPGSLHGCCFQAL